MNELFSNFAAMKAKNILIYIVGVLIIPSYLSSCGEDRWAAYAEQTRTTRWIDDSMRVWYYWADEIPHTDKLNYFTAPEKFFGSLLSKKDKYSHIDSLTNPTTTRSIPYTDYSYGFQFSTESVEGNDTALYARILYVANASPASDIKLQRGEWIMKINGEPITQKNSDKLYGSTAMKLTIGHYDAEKKAIVAYGEPRQIAAARSIDDNPVHYHNVYIRNNKRIGYLVYNHFSPGATNNTHEYDNDLRNVFRNFANQQVNEFILDLRYNNGGLLSCAELMCSMLAPSSALGKDLGYLEFNNRTNPKEVSFKLNADLIGEGANLNLKTLYVLTGSQTASASEMVINCLQPYMEVVLIGSTTVGKNVGSLTFSSQELKITMSPIVCQIYNSKGESDYASGFTPEFSVNETDAPKQFLPFGNTEERMLSTALGVIDGSIKPDDKKQSSALKVITITNSIDRRASQAVRIR
ncbi:S41 family peptidase [Bacteroides heparinolyticus]|uniref:S41 family peptidase n=1 Tax=Prevotella heparinolytica TaxID=28113 RepID=UPI0023F1DDC6|nr:S41 family peptidase [Bacteroides heparinolyticus]